MLAKSQLSVLSKKYKINESVILREYIQILVLDKIYSFNNCQTIFFKGGTCIHLIYGGKRFSEDLDFTVNMGEKEFLEFIEQPFKELEKENEFIIKENKSIFGKSFLIKYINDLVRGDMFISLDFSFREKVISPQKNILQTDLPVILNNYIYCLSKEEIVAEKIRAILTRDKGRDYYDLWYLLASGVEINKDMINKKMNYYNKEFSEKILKDKIDKFNKRDFILDLSPFVDINTRDRLGDIYEYIKDFLINKV